MRTRQSNEIPADLPVDIDSSLDGVNEAGRRELLLLFDAKTLGFQEAH